MRMTVKVQGQALAQALTDLLNGHNVVATTVDPRWTRIDFDWPGPASHSRNLPRGLAKPQPRYAEMWIHRNFPSMRAIVREASSCATPRELAKTYSPKGDGEHPKYLRMWWRNGVENCDTISGYWEWVAHQLNEENEG